MFKKIQIQNFRGIPSCTLSDFSKINFLYGKNNSGKSTVLESLFLLSGISSPAILINENAMRNYTSLSEDDLNSFFYNFNTNNEISFFAEEDDNTNRNIVIKIIEKPKQTFQTEDEQNILLTTNETKKEYGLIYNFSVSNIIQKSVSMKIRKNSSGFSVSIPSINDYEEKYTTMYLPPAFQFRVVLDKLSELIKNKQKKEIIDGLRILSNNVKDITILNNEVFIDIGLSQMVPLKLMGDGMRKILSILVSIYTCKNGAVIVDEIDNGLHFSAITPLITLIAKVCKENNVQFFASTHSKEIFEQIFKLQAFNLSDFNFYTLFYESNKINTRCFDGNEAKKAFENWGLEIR